MVLTVEGTGLPPSIGPGQIVAQEGCVRRPGQDAGDWILECRGRLDYGAGWGDHGHPNYLGP